MDNRNLYQFQVGFDLFQLDEGPGDTWPPTWPGENILAWMKLRVFALGSVTPEFLLREVTNDFYARVRPDQVSLSILDPADAATKLMMWSAIDTVKASPVQFGGHLLLYTEKSGSNTDYAFFSPGAYITAGWEWPPYFRLKSAFVLSGANDSGTFANIVPSGSALIYWDDSADQLKAIDNAVVTFAFGYNDRGDPAAFDFDETDLTLDGAWHDLDLSSIVPVGAKAVEFHMELNESHKGDGLRFRKNGNSNVINHSEIVAPVAASVVHQDMVVGCDSNRVIEYILIGASIDGVDIVVKGWFI